MSKWDGSEYQQYLEALFKSDPDFDGRVKDVAARLGKSVFTVYDMLKGRIDPGIDAIPEFYLATGEIRIIEWFTKRCRDLKVSKLCLTGDLDGDLTDELLIAAGGLGELCEHWHRTKADGKVTAREREKLNRAVHYLGGVLDRMRTELNSMEG